MTTSFATHMVLDVVGLIPVIGEPADLLNASIYLAEGNYLDASLSAAGAIPFAGWAASGAQIVKNTYRAANAAMEVADTVGDGIRLADNLPLSAATPPASTITTFDPVPPMVKMPDAPVALPKTPDVAPPLKQIEAAPAAAVPDATTGRFTAHPDGTIVDNAAEAATDPTFYRGARPGEEPSFVPRPNEFRVDPETGLVRDTHGVSVYDNPDSVASRGLDPHMMDPVTVPPELRIIQRGADPLHYEIVPRPDAELTPDEFVSCLLQIRCGG